MDEFNLNRFEGIKIDYTRKELPASVQLFKPSVFRDGKAYCCLLGPDPQVGIFGCGYSPLQAMADWDEQFNAELAQHSESEGIIQYIKKRIEEVRRL